MLFILLISFFKQRSLLKIKKKKKKDWHVFFLPNTKSMPHLAFYHYHQRRNWPAKRPLYRIKTVLHKMPKMLPFIQMQVTCTYMYHHTKIIKYFFVNRFFFKNKLQEAWTWINQLLGECRHLVPSCYSILIILCYLMCDSVSYEWY